MSSEFYEENRGQKLLRRLKEEPLIPFGCALTCWALLGATRAIRSGDHNKTNRMFRARIYAQGFTLVAMVAGSMYWQTDRQKRKEFDKVVLEEKAKEKNQAWIRELEARDEEEKEFRAAREKRRQLAAGTPPVKKDDVKPVIADSMVDPSEEKGSILNSLRGAWGGKK